VSEWQRPDLEDSAQCRQRQRMLQLAARNGVSHGLLGHQLDSDHLPCADVLRTRAFNVFGQPVMAKVIVEGGIGLHSAQISPPVVFVVGSVFAPCPKCAAEYPDALGTLTSPIAPMSDNGCSEQKNLPEASLKEQVADYVDSCRQRITTFVATNYAGRGAIGLNCRAFGFDVLVAPFNFLMGFPNFLLRVLAVVLDFIGARKVAQRLARSHLGLPTKVQKTLSERLMTDLLDLTANPGNANDGVRKRISAAAQEPVRMYVQTRNVAADITSGTLAAILGLAVLHQFTPGSISAGSALAQTVAREQAVSEFSFGEILGRLYCTVFPVNPSLSIIVLALLLVMIVIAVVAAFSGIIHDPIQTAAGIHHRRLNQMLDAIEESAIASRGKGYRPKDTFFGRVFDLIDWVKGVLSF
jgi:hypothetical protein